MTMYFLAQMLKSRFNEVNAVLIRSLTSLPFFPAFTSTLHLLLAHYCPQLLPSVNVWKRWREYQSENWETAIKALLLVITGSGKLHKVLINAMKQWNNVKSSPLYYHKATFDFSLKNYQAERIETLFQCGSDWAASSSTDCQGSSRHNAQKKVNI